MNNHTLQPVITRAGFNALYAAIQHGQTMALSHVVLGDGAYSVTGHETTLRSPQWQGPLLQLEKIADKQLRVTAVIDGPQEFWIKELGFLLDDGTLFAVWSDPQQALGYKTAYAQVLLQYDIMIDSVPIESITVSDVQTAVPVSMLETFTSFATTLQVQQRRLLTLEREAKDAEQQRLSDTIQLLTHQVSLQRRLVKTVF